MSNRVAILISWLQRMYWPLALKKSLTLAGAVFALTGFSQTATIHDAWWTFQQDCDGDACTAGLLSGDMARLNWNPEVTNCNGTLTVYERVSVSQCGSNSWTPIFTNAPHITTACRITDQQHLDIALGAGCTCWDYRIEIFRDGQGMPDFALSPTNDSDLAHHLEESLGEDFCNADNFVTCAMLSGNSGTTSASTAMATKETGEPDHAGNLGGKSIWLCWTATTNKAVSFDTISSTFDTLLAVYTGNSVSNLTLVASNDDIDGANNRQSRVTFFATNGMTYHIAIDGYGGVSGMAVLNWLTEGIALPDLILWDGAVGPRIAMRTFSANDCEVQEGCAIAGTRRLLKFSTEARNIGVGDLVLGNPATNSLFEYSSCHGHYHFEQFAEYRLRDTNGNLIAQANKPGFCLEDQVAWSPAANPLAKYTCGNQGLQTGWVDVYDSGLPCQYIDVTSVAPGDYILEMEVDPYHLIPESNESNNLIQLTVTIPTNGPCLAPSNDHFTNAQVVLNAPASLIAVTDCATKETGEPRHAGNLGGRSVWYSWTPAATHQAVITTFGSDFDTLLGVYTGSALASLSTVATNDDSGGGWQSRVTFTAIAGTTYYIAVDGYNGGPAADSGNLLLSIDPPANDNFTNAFSIYATEGTTNGSTTVATKEFGEPAHAYNIGGHSVWFIWTAPSNGPIEFNTVGSAFDTTLAVYTGASVSGVTLISASNNDFGGAQYSRVGFTAVAAVTYRIAVDGFSGAAGSYVLNWKSASLLSAIRSSNGQIRILLTGVTGQRYTLQTSTNLLDWSPLTTITLLGSSQEFFLSTTASPHFYRSRLVP